MPRHVVIIGAGIGGLSAALHLAAKGCAVTVLEAASAPGGKMREVTVLGQRLDAGPTVFTMRWIFEEIFASAGADLAREITLERAVTLARHAWPEADTPPARLDLFADRRASAEAIAAFSSPDEGQRYLAFCKAAKGMHDTLDHAFMRAARPSQLDLIRATGVMKLWQTRPFSTLWQALGEQFSDARLRQLFGRYATYCGSSPYLAPATLMLIAHVEQEGVWFVKGGMHQLALAFARVIERAGGSLRYGARVEEILLHQGRVGGVRLASGEVITADAVVVNADTNALALGHFGAAARRAHAVTPPAARSLSAITWSMVAKTSGFPLLRHNVFFSKDYAREFERIFKQHRLPDDPTIYICAQDRMEEDNRTEEGAPHQGEERLLVLVNAPPTGDGLAAKPLSDEEIDACESQTFRALQASGLTITCQKEAQVRTTPQAFEALFPATGGALYGRATHGAMASFSRPGARTKVPGLYCAGGSTHPGAGIPMVALSGRIAAQTLLADWGSTTKSHPVAMPGGISTP